MTVNSLPYAVNIYTCRFSKACFIGLKDNSASAWVVLRVNPFPQEIDRDASFRLRLRFLIGPMVKYKMAKHTSMLRVTLQKKAGSMHVTIQRIWTEKALPNVMKKKKDEAIV